MGSDLIRSNIFNALSSLLGVFLGNLALIFLPQNCLFILIKKFEGLISLVYVFLMIDTAKREFFCDDESIHYPHNSDTITLMVKNN